MECPSCGRALSANARQTEDIRRAYEILERWQSTDLFERISTTTPLTTLKQQDRAPLLNIPLGPRSILKSTAAAEKFLSGPAIDLHANRDRVNASRRIDTAIPNPASQVPSLPAVRVNPVPQATDQALWDLLVAPEPLLAAAAPAIDDDDAPSAPVQASPVATKVSPRPDTASNTEVSDRIAEGSANETSSISRSIDAGHTEHRAERSEDAVGNRVQARSDVENAARFESRNMPQAMLDEVMSDAASTQRLNPFPESDGGQSWKHPDDIAESVVGSDWNEDSNCDLDLHQSNAGSTQQTAFRRQPEVGPFETDDDTESNSVRVTVESALADECAETDDIEIPLNTQASSRDTGEDFASDDVVSRKIHSATIENTVIEGHGNVSAAAAMMSTKVATHSTGPAEILQSVVPMLMSSASIHEESADERSKSAESANDGKQLLAEATKKSQRTPMRRPPLHRRFQNVRPVSESSAGSDTVTRKLRLDQTGGNAEAAQAKEPVTALPSSVAPETKIVSNSPKPGRRFRIDNAESIDEITGTDGRRSRTHGLPRNRYIDEAHETQLRGPHFEVTAPRRSNLTSMTGQFLAYLGVLGLTIGTAMVIYGHFGGYSEYTPTGWLVTTVAQMLLFLGVINLVSGGIEQNNEDVSRRINTLGEQLLRIEQVTSEAMRGPKLPARLYADPETAAQESARETVTVDRQ
jgi:hypothetical protein